MVSKECTNAVKCHCVLIPLGVLQLCAQFVKCLCVFVPPAVLESRSKHKKVSKHGAERPQKPYGLSGTGRIGEGFMEVGREGDCYTYRYSVNTRMTPALRWAVMRAILMFH